MPHKRHLELIISRSGYTGELGYELYTPADQASVLWDYLLKKGRSSPSALRCRGDAELEDREELPLYGSDINEDYNPFHAGLSR